MLANDIIKMLYHRYKSAKKQRLEFPKCRSCHTTHGAEKSLFTSELHLKYAFKHAMNLRRYEKKTAKFQSLLDTRWTGK